MSKVRLVVPPGRVTCSGYIGAVVDVVIDGECVRTGYRVRSNGYIGVPDRYTGEVATIRLST